MLAVGMTLAGLSSVLVVLAPFLSKYLVDDAIKGGRRELLIPLLLGCMGAVLLKTLLHIACVYFMELASQHMLYNIRMKIFTNIQYQEMTYFSRVSAGDIITRITGDLEYIRHFTAYITYLTVEMIVSFSAALVVLISVNLSLTLCLMAVMPFIFLATLVYNKKARPIFRSIRYRLSQLNVAATENIAGNRVVKAFAREEYENEKFDEKSRDYMQANLKAAYTWQKLIPVINFLAQSLSVINLLAGGIFAAYGKITIGELTMFTSLSWALANPIKNISTMLNDYQRFSASVEKVIEICCARPLIADRNDCIDKKERFDGKIEFRNVTFSYGKKKILDNVSFTVMPRQTVAIMGPTGCGKTTVANLIMRFFDVNGGEVLLDDVGIRMRSLHSVHNAAAVATQEVFLFSDTIENNIAFCNPDMPLDEVKQYARLACADDFIMKTEDGYDTIIGERGVGLSGGQRQRIALARALAAKPAILILDDTTSALDMETEREIQHNLKALPFDCTKVIIAQRISSVRNADMIIVLQNGKIQTGTHVQLAATCRYYRDVCELQDEPNLPEFVGKDGE